MVDSVTVITSPTFAIPARRPQRGSDPSPIWKLPGYHARGDSLLIQ